MSSKSKKIELNEEFIAMWREVQSLWNAYPLNENLYAYIPNENFVPTCKKQMAVWVQL